MNQTLDLILENLRLSSIEKLLLEATTEEEVQSGIQMINESINQVEGILFENTEEELRHRREKAAGDDYSRMNINKRMEIKRNMKRILTGSNGSGFKFKSPTNIDYFGKIQHKYN